MPKLGTGVLRAVAFASLAWAAIYFMTNREAFACRRMLSNDRWQWPIGYQIQNRQCFDQPQLGRSS